MDRPIGMFDSGFGGLTVARAVIDLLPHEHLVYIGDTGRYPYGPRPQAEVREFAHQLAWSLVKDHDVKAIVVACNTASAAALDELEAELPVPVIDVVAPGARALVKASRSGKVRVIGTVGTIRSGVRGERLQPPGTCSSPRRRARAWWSSSSVARPVATRFTSWPSAARSGTRASTPLLLGCTHYPYLAHVIADVMGSDVTLVSSAIETALVARDELQAAGLLREPGGEPAEHRFLSSGDISWFADLGGRLLGPELRDAAQWHHD
jgi:glutamate racemase